MKTKFVAVIAILFSFSVAAAEVDLVLRCSALSGEAIAAMHARYDGKDEEHVRKTTVQRNPPELRDAITAMTTLAYKAPMAGSSVELVNTFSNKVMDLCLAGKL